MKSVKVKQTLVMGLVALILVAGYYRWTVQKAEDLPVVSVTLPEDVAETSEADETGFFAQSRQSRDISRSQLLEANNIVLENPNSTAEAKSEAQRKVTAITSGVQGESIAESLVKSKGYDDCVILSSENGEVSVIVSGIQLDSAKVNQIKDIVVSQMNVKPTQIKISNYNAQN